VVKTAVSLVLISALLPSPIIKANEIDPAGEPNNNTEAFQIYLPIIIDSTPPDISVAFTHSTVGNGYQFSHFSMSSSKLSQPAYYKFNTGIQGDQSVSQVIASGFNCNLPPEGLYEVTCQSNEALASGTSKLLVVKTATGGGPKVVDVYVLAQNTPNGAPVYEQNNRANNFASDTVN